MQLSLKFSIRLIHVTFLANIKTFTFSETSWEAKTMSRQATLFSHVKSSFFVDKDASSLQYIVDQFDI